jgi:hypothetical protein
MRTIVNVRFTCGVIDAVEKGMAADAFKLGDFKKSNRKEHLLLFHALQ